MRSLLITVFVLSACGKNNEPPPPSSGSPTAKPESGPSHPRNAAPAHEGAPPAGGAGGSSQAERMFGNMCAMCHGADGTGNGPAAASLNPKPRNYRDPAWQASVTDDALKEVILKGGQALGKSAAMPPQPQLADQPEVLDGLVKIIRSFGQQ